MKKVNNSRDIILMWAKLNKASYLKESLDINNVTELGTDGSIASLINAYRSGVITFDEFEQKLAGMIPDETVTDDDYCISSDDSCNEPPSAGVPDPIVMEWYERFKKLKF